MLTGAPSAETGPDEHADLEGGAGSSWTRAVVVGLTVYLVSRLCVIAGTAVRAAQVTVDARADGEPDPGVGSIISGVLTSWDGL